MQIWTTAAVTLLSGLVYLALRFYASRREFQKLQRAGLPMPDHHPIFGHLLLLKKIAASLPPDTIMHNVMWKIARQFSGGVYYLNLWPFSGTILVVCNAYVASQVGALDLGKPKSVAGPIDTITGGPSLLTMEGAEWKRWRRLFNKGFSAAHLIDLAPSIAEEIVVFRDLLISKCRDAPGGRSDIFQMEEMAVRMTFDVIARVVLDDRLQYQVRDNPLAAALRSSIDWTSWRGQLNPFAILSVRPIVHWWNSRIMNRYIGREIDRRLTKKSVEAAARNEKDRSAHSKSILSLLIEDLLHDPSSSKGTEHVEQAMKAAMCAQVRGFLLGGHDSSAGALTYCYYLLSEHQDARNRLVAEHNTVFGDVSVNADTLAQIRADPQKLNELPYTTAFIKETLRLFPPAGGMQMGRPGAFLYDETGRCFPTEDCGIWTISQGIHYNESYWVDPEAFLPERWLAPLHTGGTRTKGAWRPFEQGPRNCIGQALVMLELKIALVLTARDIDVVPAYEEWDALHPRKGEVINTVDGNRAYQAEKIAAHPADGFPVRVQLRT